MRILIVVPKYQLKYKPDYTYMFPLGLAYISSVLKKAGYNVDCLNMNHIEGTPTDILNAKLNETKYDMVGIGGIALDYALIDMIIKTVKSHKSKPITILGGPIITSEPKLIYEAMKPTYGVIGEGEETIVELVQAISKKKDLSKVKGIVYSKNKKTMLTPERESIADLDSIPFPDFGAFDFETKVQNSFNNDNVSSTFNNSEPRVYPILASRACPYNCTFCYHVGKYRTRSVANVMEEIRYAVKKYRISALLIYDDCFASNQKRLLEFCVELKKLKKEISWELSWASQLRVTTVDEKLLKIMKDAGCCEIGYGFESYSPTVLNSMKKGITPKQIDHALKITFKQKIAVNGNFIFGDVAETKETSDATLDYWKKNCQGQLYITLITPYPGSQIYNHCLKKGIIKDKMKFIKVGMLNFTDNMTDNMSEKEFSDLKKQIIKLSEKYFVCVIPKSKKKNGDKYYSLTVKCPFCKKQTKYDYCRIINQFHYGFDAVCRHCYKHYYVASLPQYIVLKKIRFIIPHYIKTVRFLKTLMIKKKIK